MKSALPLTLVLIGSLGLIGCRFGDGGSTADGATGSVTFEPMMWRVGGDAGNRLTKEAFKTMVDRAFLTVKPGSMRIERAELKGEFTSEAGEGVLMLEVRFDIEGLPVPVTTSLGATSAVNAPNAAEAMVQKGVSDLAVAVKELFHLAMADADAWIRGIGSSEPDVQVLSARLLGKKREKRAMRALVELLNDPREPVAEAAAEALREMGDPKAVPLVIQSIKRNDLRSEVRAIEIMGVLGGDEAVAYLEMIAVGHEMDEVRRVSADLLGALRKRMKQH